MKNLFPVVIFSLSCIAISGCSRAPTQGAENEPLPVGAKQAFLPFESEEETSVEDLVEGTYVVNTDWGDPSIMDADQ